VAPSLPIFQQGIGLQKNKKNLPAQKTGGLYETRNQRRRMVL
jgi:hypothetical protein